ncbi:hypothetical protein M0R36_10135 [bacterium]|jgi:hypothetical protein|nr:hypothetical protein [bacterium]
MINIYEQKQNNKQNLINTMMEIVTQGFGSEGKRVKYLKEKLEAAVSKLEFLKKKLSTSEIQEKVFKTKIVKSEENIAIGLDKLKKLIKEE